MLRFVLATLIVVVVLALVLKLLVPRVVHRFVYYPARLDAGQTEPLRWGLEGAESVWIRSEDGVRLHAWWVPAPETTRRLGTAIYLHGNAGNIAGRAGIGLALARIGLDVLMLDYRGYGASEGSPEEQGLYRDAEAAYRHLTQTRGVARERIVLFGESLGGAVAIELATRVPVGAIVLVAPLTSTVRIARAHYPLPDFLLDWPEHRFDALGRIDRVSAPILVVHGDRDRIIPRSEARELFLAARGPKRWFDVLGFGHNDIYQDPGFWRAVERFLGEHANSR